MAKTKEQKAAAKAESAKASQSVQSQPKDWANIAKWLLVILIVAAGVVGNVYFKEQPLLYRVLALLALAGVAGFVAYLTTQGKAFWELVKGARTEIRKVIWPTQQETTQTSLVVLAVTVVMGLILWVLDTFFGWLTSFVIG